MGVKCKVWSHQLSCGTTQVRLFRDTSTEPLLYCKIAVISEIASTALPRRITYSSS